MTSYLSPEIIQRLDTFTLKIDATWSWQLSGKRAAVSH